jgi:hypothetical protein
MVTSESPNSLAISVTVTDPSAESLLRIVLSRSFNVSVKIGLFPPSIHFRKVFVSVTNIYRFEKKRKREGKELRVRSEELRVGSSELGVRSSELKTLSTLHSSLSTLHFPLPFSLSALLAFWQKPAYTLEQEAHRCPKPNC